MLFMLVVYCASMSCCCCNCSVGPDRIIGGGLDAHAGIDLLLVLITEE